jgi:CNH domain
MPTSVAYIGTGQIMGWGNKAIEIRSVESGHLDGVFMHKKAQKLKFLCERNDKVMLNNFKFIIGAYNSSPFVIARCSFPRPRVDLRARFIS